jgi:hypothetical protein
VGSETVAQVLDGVARDKSASEPRPTSLECSADPVASAQLRRMSVDVHENEVRETDTDPQSWRVIVRRYRSRTLHRSRSVRAVHAPVPLAGSTPYDELVFFLFLYRVIYPLLSH